MSEPRKDTVTVVGAGLVGSLLSIYLARRGHTVELLERRPDMRRETVDAGRSINLAISTRGLHALRQLDLEDEALKHAIPMRGRMIHPPQGALVYQPYGKDDSQHINSLSRAWLNAFLMTAAEATGQVNIRFKQRVTQVDFGSGALTVHDDATGQVRQEPGRVVFGTDGSASAIRQALEQRPDFQGTQEQLGHGYKELTIPAGPGARSRWRSTRCTSGRAAPSC